MCVCVCVCVCICLHGCEFFFDVIIPSAFLSQELPDQGMKLAFVELGDTKIEVSFCLETRCVPV